MFKNAIVSVSDKSGVYEFLKPLCDKGLNIYSSGGTAKYLREKGLIVTDVSDLTGFPEVFGGRVKTLHPHIHMGLLARRDHDEDINEMKSRDLPLFDLAVVNLYPFEDAKKSNKSLGELVEYIDVGGPTMLRAAAKNFSHITTISSSDDYEWVLFKALKDDLTLDDRKKLAAKVFEHTSHYDKIISSSLTTDLTSHKTNTSNNISNLNSDSLVAELRYGENPHQKAKWFSQSENGLHKAKHLQGKALSYNNLLDLEAAVSSLRAFSTEKSFSTVAVKHLNPCGVSTSYESSTDSISKALKADPVSVFGGIIACDFEVTEEHAKIFNSLFLECIIAPKFARQSLDIFKKKKNLRCLEWPEIVSSNCNFESRTIIGGVLTQEYDAVDIDTSSWKFVGDKPSESQLKDIIFTWKCCAFLKSNAIAVGSKLSSRGMGMGQVNRVDAVEQALSRALKYHPDEANLCLASDAFFPFADSIEKIANFGRVDWIIQPGGSIKDQEVISAAEKSNIGMILTGRRHFRH